MPLAASASEWVRQLPRGARVDWAELEARVLRDHLRVLRELGGAGRAVRTERAGWRLVFGIAVIAASIVGVAVVWAPVWGLATLAGDAFGRVDVDGAMAIPVAGAAMVVASAVQLALLVRTLSGRSSGDEGGIGAGIAVLGVLTAVATGLVGARQGVPGWQLWLAIALLGAAIGAANAIIARRTHPRGRAQRSGRRGAAAPRAAADLVRALDARTRDALEDDRRSAVEWLRMQGSIGPDEAAAALRVELGRLGETLGR